MLYIPRWHYEGLLSRSVGLSSSYLWNVSFESVIKTRGSLTPVCDGWPCLFHLGSSRRKTTNVGRLQGRGYVEGHGFCVDARA